MCRLLNIFLIVSTSLFFAHVSQGEPIKIGIIAPFSGPYIASGDQQWHGAFQAAEDINEQGGVNGDKIILINADGACDPKIAVEAAKKLAKRNVSFVVGPNCSSSSLAVAKIYGEAKLIMITPAATNPAITELGYETIFRTCGTDDKQVAIASSYITKNLKAKNIIVVHDSSVYGKGLADATKNELEKMGAKVVHYETILPSQEDFHELVEIINKAKPDVVYYGGYHADAGNLLRNIRESGNQVIFFAGDGIATSAFVRSAGGPSMVKDVYMSFYDPFSIQAARKVIKKFEENRIIPNGYTLNAYAAVQAIAEAIKQTGSHDSQKIAKWLHSNKINSVIGELEWDAKGDLKNAPYIIYKWNDDGEYKRAD